MRGARPDRRDPRPGRSKRERLLRGGRHPDHRRRRGPRRHPDDRGPARRGPGDHGTTLLRAETRIGRVVLGDGIATSGARGRAGASSRHDARSSSPSPAPGTPSGWASRPGCGLPAGRSRRSCCPQGEDAKRLSVVEGSRPRPRPAPRASGANRSSRSVAARSGTRPGSSRPPTCAASRSSTCRRPWSPRSIRRSVARPASTCPRARTWSGAFHLPERHDHRRRRPADTPRAPAPGRARRGGQDGGPRRRAAVRAAGDRRRRRSPPGRPRSTGPALVAEVVERCAWAKVEVVLADEREHDPTGGRITLNLGHSVGHARRGDRRRTAGCSTARPWRTACAPPARSGRRWA